MSSSTRDKVDASARALEVVMKLHAEGKCRFVHWLRSRQDIVEIVSHFVGGNATLFDASFFKEQLDFLFGYYAGESTTISDYCEYKAKADDNPEAPKSIPVLEKQIAHFREDQNQLRQSLDEHKQYQAELLKIIDDHKKYQARLIQSVDFHKEDLRQNRLDTADLEQASQQLKDKYKCMMYYWQRQQRIRDRTHHDALTVAEAQVESLQSEHASLQIENESLKSQLAEALNKMGHMSQQADRTSELMQELETSRNQFAALARDALDANGALSPAPTRATTDVDDNDDTTTTTASSVVFKEEEEMKYDDDEQKSASFFLAAIPQSLSSPPHRMDGLEWI
ncbi:hypothetical protein PG989_016157 [Apiospora arundinis]